MNRAYVGVDPGLSGGICALIPGSPMPALFEMPIAPSATDKTKSVLHGERLRGIFRKLQQECGAMLVMVESPQMRPGVMPAPPLFSGKPHFCGVCRKPHFMVNQGVASQGGFVRQGGLIEGVLIGLDIPHEFVSAKAWSGAIFGGRKLSGTDGKEQSRLLAIKLYPTLAERLKLKKTHGLAEAALIARYAQSQFTPPTDVPF